jgi:hypothetical protein
MKTSLKIILLLFCYFALSFLPVFAAKMIAGEISYRNISNLTYEFTATIYQLSANLDSTIVVDAGSGNFTLTTSNNTSAGTLCGMNVSKSTFVFTHTYPGNGYYDIYVYASTRIDSIVNMVNSVTANMTLKATLIINAFLGINDSPTFNYPPIDIANLNTLFINNSAVIDIDGDSLSYQLVTPLGVGGTPVAGYILPPASNSFSMDSVTGDIVWDSPIIVGYYSVGVLLTEWRSGQVMGTYNRDMLIAICQPNAITEFQSENAAINIFPNPTSDNLIIASVSSSENKYLNIYNAIGARILNENFTEQKHFLNVSSFAKGIYLIEVRTEKAIIAKRIVKQ